MKAIVLATDFSKSADSASDLAAHLAILLNTRLVVVHVYQQAMNILSSDSIFTLTEKNKISTQRKLYRLRDRLQKAFDGKLNISIIARKGNTLDTIKAVALEEMADLIVMGTMGTKSPGVQYFGSQATEMILHAPVPLLLVPSSAGFKPFKTIVVAIDLNSSVDALEVDQILRFAERFKATLDIVCVSETPDQPEIRRAGERIRHLMAHCPHTLTIVEGQNLVRTIDQFEKDTKADLLIILPKPHNKLLFSILESISQEISRQSRIPALAIV